MSLPLVDDDDDVAEAKVRICVDDFSGPLATSGHWP